MPVMVLCYNCKNSADAGDTNAPEVICTISGIMNTPPRTRCEHYAAKEGTNKTPCVCTGCTHNRTVLVLDESAGVGYIQGVECGAKKKSPIRHPGRTCPDFSKEAQKPTRGAA